MNYFVYMLECSDGSYYTGYTNDLDKRVQKHNNQKGGAKYTKSRRPVKLIYSETCSSKSEAMKREYQIKKLNRKEKERILLKQ